MVTELLKIQGLRTQFFTSAGTVKAVDGVTYDVEEGETVAVVGESGCGKSVTALSIMRLVAEPAGRVVDGKIIFQGNDLLQLNEEEMRKVRGNNIAMVFQEPMTSLNPVLSIGLQLKETVQQHLDVDDETAYARWYVGCRTEIGAVPSPSEWRDATTRHDSHGVKLRAETDYC